MVDMARMRELEARFDGPIPQHLLDEARELPDRAYLQALSSSFFFTNMVKEQIKIIRGHRARGSLSDAHLADLALYRERRRHWRREFAKCQR